MSDTYAGFWPYTTLFVYAQAGERVQLGSSAIGLGDGDIRVYAPGTALENRSDFPGGAIFDSQVFSCVDDDPGSGLISTRAQELAGPENAPDADPNTWSACEFVAPATGLYPVIFMPPDAANNLGNANNLVGTPLQMPGQVVSIWDVTVRDPGGNVHPGRTFSRTYTQYAAMTDPVSDLRAYVYTKTGYEYQIDFDDHRGLGWSLFSDDQGMVDRLTGERIFASFRCGDDAGSNECVFDDAVPAADDRRYPIFVNRPDPLVISGPGGLAETAGYATTPITPASTPLGISFAGSAGQTNATNQGAGGTLTFTSPAAMDGLGYTLEIDLNRNGVYGDVPDVVDSGELSATGSNSFAWNGRDSAGAVPACGDYAYRVRSTLSEVHFPMIDVEDSAGTHIQRLTLPSDPTLGNPFALSYNDRDPYKNGYAVTNASPGTVVNGDSSAPGFHAWTGLTGNTDYVDTWAQLPEVISTGTLRLLCTDLQIVKSLEATPVVPGEDATFVLTVTNNGPDAATNVVVSDPLPAGFTFKSATAGCALAGTTVTCATPTLAAGATATFKITGGVASSVERCDEVQNTATVSNDVPDTNPANNSSTVCPPIEQRTGVKITKAASAAEVAPGGQVMYTLVISNDGPSDARSVRVSDPLPAGLTLVSARPAQGSCSPSGNTVNCTLGRLAAGGSTQVLVTANVTAPSGCITNVAAVEATGDRTPEDNTASAQVCVIGGDPLFDLVVDKKASPTKVKIGQTVTYTITVTNKGPDAAPNAKLADTLNQPVTVVSIRTSQGTCGKTLPLDCSFGTINAGGKVTVTVRAKHTKAGKGQRNAASATADGKDNNPNDNMDTATVDVTKIALRLTKKASVKTVPAGDRFSYTIKVTNPTKGEARNVRVCDRLPSGVVYVRSSPRATVRNGQQCWTVARLGAGKSRTFRLTVRAGNGAFGTKRNTVTATSPDTLTKRARATVRITDPQPGVTG